MTDAPAKTFSWSLLIPDTRSFVTMGMFALAWRMLEMIDSEPKLLENPAFMTLATLVVGGSGLGAAVSYFYGSSKSADKQTSDAVATLSAAATNNTLPLDPTKQGT